MPEVPDELLTIGEPGSVVGAEHQDVERVVVLRRLLAQVDELDLVDAVPHRPVLRVRDQGEAYARGRDDDRDHAGDPLLGEQWPATEPGWPAPSAACPARVSLRRMRAPPRVTAPAASAVG